MPAEYSLSVPSLRLDLHDDGRRLTLWDTCTGQRLLFTKTPSLFRPVLHGAPVDGQLIACEGDEGRVTLRFAGAGVTEYAVTLTAVEAEDAIDITCSFRVSADTQLNRLELFPPETTLTLYDVVNFRNRHFTPHTWPELLLGKRCETDTYSLDWHFAPHPTMLLFRKLETSLFVGAVDLPTAFGMYLTVERFQVQDWSLDYGAAPHGQPLAGGERFTAPRIRLFARHGQSVWDTMDDFAGQLVRDGQIPDPAEKTRPAWWSEPLYCTWCDQKPALLAAVAEDPRVAEAYTQTGSPGMLTEAFVREAVAVIKRERLPVRTILLDEGWSVARGQWEPHPERFPDLRGLVDDLHADGFKVMIWWNWAEVADVAEVNPAHLMAGGKRNRHGRRMRDYSSPRVQEEYLQPLFRRFFSSAPDCYNLDGVKTDFLADKVHPDFPLADPSWRGEENYFVHITELFYREMRRYKPDAQHMGCAGHFRLAQWIDTNRTYDVATTDYREHEERGHMLRHTAPGAIVSYDMHSCVENLDRFLASAQQYGAAVQIGNVLYIREDRFTPPHPAHAAYFDLLRRYLGAR